MKEYIKEHLSMSLGGEICGTCPFGRECDICLYLFPEIGLFDWAVGDRVTRNIPFKHIMRFHGDHNIPCPCWIFDEETILKTISEVVD